MQEFSRRTALSAPLGFLTLNSLSPLLAQGAGAEPHFYLQIILEGGADSLYMFDSRPNSMTAAGLVTNYSSTDAVVWDGSNGGTCLASSLAAKAMRPYKKRLAIVNGVHMPLGFEGHDQNVNSLLTANPFGGKYFAGSLPTDGRPIDFVQVGKLFGANLSNKTRALSVSPTTAASLATQAQASTQQDSQSPWKTRILKRAAHCGEGTGLLAKACLNYVDGMIKSQSLASILAQTKPDFSHAPSELEKAAQVAIAYFKAGLSKACLLTSSLGIYNFDTHSPEDAKKSEETFTSTLTDLAGVLQLLESTAFDSSKGLSMLDVTTVMISSEFSRTRGQAGKSAEQAGTDHNPLANMVLLLGKGIRGDSVIGSSDLDQLVDGRSFSPVSGAHHQVDEALMKKMGRPFDFSTQTHSLELPAQYAADDYMTAASVMNTVLAAFGVNSELWLSNSTNRNIKDSKPAKIISSILV
ncbi:MAG: DUF1501 domain-containing protein [Proteobacteria bacterium]|nr:DUF1501 domain-containing protein [Pseudomonadota bacterium]